MLAYAWSEVRLHPTRYLATLLAIAISVAFLAGAPVVVNTQAEAVGRGLSIHLAQADAVIEGAAPVSDAAVSRVDGVAAASPLNTWSSVVRQPTGDYAMLSLLELPPAELRWTRLAAGAWPTTRDEVALASGLARNIGVGVGGTVRTADGTSWTVVGLLDQPESAQPNGVLAPSFFTQAEPTGWIVKAAPGVSQQTLADRLSALVSGTQDAKVLTGDQARQNAIENATRGIEVFTYLLWGFAAVALVVGMITVANTFTITLAQRRRQIGLLRAVGASGAQLRARFAWEAGLLGLVGSVTGVGFGLGAAAVVSAFLGTLAWGLSIPWVQVAIAVVIGVLATLAASWLPIVRSTRVAPLEALVPLAASDRRRASVLRGVVCGGLVLLGAAAAAASLIAGSSAFFVAVASGALISLGVLFGAPLFVPPLLRLAGRAFRWAGPTARLAADNAERNPRRAATTASALMLAIGLMVTLQVGSASMKATSLAEIEEHYPVDVSVLWMDEKGHPASIPEADATRLEQVDGVAGQVLLAAASAELDGGAVVTLIGYDPAIASVTDARPAVTDRVALVNPYEFSDTVTTITVVGKKGTVTLQAERSRLVASGQVMVSAATLAAVARPQPGAMMWLSVPDRGRAIPVAAAVASIAGVSAQVDGSIVQASMIEQVVNLLLAITTGLLGVAVLIALIGVSNTLGLSVVERTRESALLRALGLQARSLRAMLMIEAIEVAVVGVAVGVLAGAFFGWLAVTSLGRASAFDAVRFAVDVPMTLAMVALAVVAAALASVLPGRRAAKASPTEALADI